MNETLFIATALPLVILTGIAIQPEAPRWLHLVVLIAGTV